MTGRPAFHGAHVDELPEARAGAFEEGGLRPDGRGGAGKACRHWTARAQGLASRLARQVEKAAGRPIDQGTVLPGRVGSCEAESTHDHMRRRRVQRGDPVVQGQ